MSLKTVCGLGDVLWTRTEDENWMYVFVRVVYKKNKIIDRNDQDAFEKRIGASVVFASGE